MIKYLNAFLILAAISICTPSDGQFHWAKNYRVDVQNLRERLQKLRNAELNGFDSQVLIPRFDSYSHVEKKEVLHSY